MISFFTETEPLRGFQGDTFPEFGIAVDSEEVTDSWTMHLLLEYYSSPGTAVFTKECTYNSGEGGAVFTVQLLTEDTENLCGAYHMHFVLTNPDGLEFRRLYGLLTVIPSPREVIR